MLGRAGTRAPGLLGAVLVGGPVVLAGMGGLRGWCRPRWCGLRGGVIRGGRGGAEAGLVPGCGVLLVCCWCCGE